MSIEAIRLQNENSDKKGLPVSFPLSGELGGASLISEEVKEIISYRPHWMIRKGNILFFAVLISLLALTWFIKYPDIVSASTRLVALNAPKLISAKTQGKLMKLFVSNEDEVNKDQHLGYMESTATYDEVIKLETWVRKTISITQSRNYDALSENPLPVLSGLGELQQVYQNFQNEWIETKQILATGYYQKKKAALQKDMKYLSNLKNDTYQQQKLTEQDQQLQNTEYKA